MDHARKRNRRMLRSWVTSFLIDRLKSMSFGSIMRSLKAFRRWKDLKDVSQSFLPSSSSLLSSFLSWNESPSSMPNRSVSHLDQFPICHPEHMKGTPYSSASEICSLLEESKVSEHWLDINDNGSWVDKLGNVYAQYHFLSSKQGEVSGTNYKKKRLRREDWEHTGEPTAIMGKGCGITYI